MAEARFIAASVQRGREVGKLGNAKFQHLALYRSRPIRAIGFERSPGHFTYFNGLPIKPNGPFNASESMLHFQATLESRALVTDLPEAFFHTCSPESMGEFWLGEVAVMVLAIAGTKFTIARAVVFHSGAATTDFADAGRVL